MHHFLSHFLMVCVFNFYCKCLLSAPNVEDFYDFESWEFWKSLSCHESNKFAESWKASFCFKNREKSMELLEFKSLDFLLLISSSLDISFSPWWLLKYSFMASLEHPLIPV